MKILHDIPLKPLHTFHFDYKCKFYSCFDNEEILKDILEKSKWQKKVIIGNGSNTVFVNDFDGFIIHNKIPKIDIIEEHKDYVKIKCGAGVQWQDFIDFCVNNEFYGIENLTGIPGTVGASPIQNIGAYGAEVSSTIDQVECIKYENNEFSKISLTNKECRFGYRDSIFKRELKDKCCITYVIFKLMKKPSFNLSYGNLNAILQGKELNLKNVVTTINTIRDGKIPDHNILGNAGCFFKNAIISKEKTKELMTRYPNIPVFSFSKDEDKIPSAWLIDKSDLKGFSKYKFEVYEKNPLIIVNRGGKGEDLLLFVEEVKKIVFDKTGIALYIEPDIF